MNQNQQSVPCRIKECSLVYEHYFLRTDEMCPICHLLLGNLCSHCINSHESSPNCRPVMGTCGHCFHLHCLISNWDTINQRDNLNRENRTIQKPCPTCQNLGILKDFEEVPVNTLVNLNEPENDDSD